MIYGVQIKAIMEYHHTPIKMTKIKNCANTKCCQGCETNGSVTPC